MKVLVTGSAGFIGSYMAQHLIGRGDEVVGLDNINDYYDVNLKYARLENLGIEKKCIEYNKILESGSGSFRFVKLDLQDRKNLTHLFEKEKFDRVCHLAAQAGVRYSITNPDAYIDSNIRGFMSILECCRNFPVEHLVYASSSSVYGLNEEVPFRTNHNVDHPVSLYAATKKSNELMAHTYSYLYKIPTTGLRFFTVYGPWGRPDMAYFSFTRAILEDRIIDVYNNGNLSRDFTYIDDIIEGVIRALDRTPQGDPSWSGKDPDPGRSMAPYRVYNIGASSPVKLMDFISAIERALGKEAVKKFLPMQPGDVYHTYADVSDFMEELGYAPETSIDEGITKFVAWYRDFYGV